MPTSDTAGGRSRWLGVTVIGLVALLIAFTVVALLDPEAIPAFLNLRTELAIITLAALAAAAIATLAWGRHREAGEPGILFQASAFAVLATYNGFVLAVHLTGGEARFGMAFDQPGQLPLWAALVSRGLAAFLLVVAGLVSIGRWRGLEWPDWAVLLMPSALLMLLLATGWEFADRLPILVAPAALRELSASPETSLLGLDSAMPFIVANRGIALLFAVGAAVAYLQFRRRPTAPGALLAVGLVTAAFAQVHASTHPDAYGGVVTTAEMMRILFYLLAAASFLLLSREDVRALRLANVRLQRLREAELAQATQEERSRLAREIHDGLAQDLWYAKLKQARLASQENLTHEARTLAAEVADALDAALADARQAVLALRPTEGSSFGEVLERYAEDFSDRFGIGIETNIAREELGLAARDQAELLRIAQEALNNVRKHADATLVRVEARTHDGVFTISVADNGRGFDLAAPRSGYGLHSMEQRAGIVGATLEIDARPQDGTRVAVRLPLRGGQAGT